MFFVSLRIVSIRNCYRTLHLGSFSPHEKRIKKGMKITDFLWREESAVKNSMQMRSGMNEKCGQAKWKVRRNLVTKQQCVDLAWLCVGRVMYFP